MKIKHLLLIPLSIAAIASSAQTKKKKVVKFPPPVVAAQTEIINANNNIPRPKLVVGIVVDQMRWDYLYRFYDRYQSNGFKRLLNEGFSCDNTLGDYRPPVTRPGHTCV